MMGGKKRPMAKQCGRQKRRSNRYFIIRWRKKMREDGHFFQNGQHWARQRALEAKLWPAKLLTHSSWSKEKEKEFPNTDWSLLYYLEPVMGRGRSRPLRNLLTRMDEVTRGPMSVLRNCMINKTRVKVDMLLRYLPLISQRCPQPVMVPFQHQNDASKNESTLLRCPLSFASLSPKNNNRNK